MEKRIALLLAALMALSLLAFGVALAESEDALDLYYTPGEDLLLADQDGVKVWLNGEKGKEYGTYEELWDAYYWFTLRVENNTDTNIRMKRNQSIDGGDSDGTWATIFDAHSVQDDIQILWCEDYYDDEDALMSALNDPQTWAMEMSFESVEDYDVNTGEYKTITPLFTAQPVTIHFTGAPEGSSAESVDSDEESVEEIAEPVAGPGEVHKDKETVKAAQQALNDAGYDCGTPDGVAGKKTGKAISDYQTDKGLTVTGTVTDETLASLGLA